MRKIDENRARNYIRKHERYKKWLVFALCVSLLTGTATLYMLNKPATAMTEEALDSVGIVIPTADAEFEQELIELTQENKENKVGEETSGDDKPEAVKEKEDSALEDESVLNADDEESVEDSEDKQEAKEEEKEAEDKLKNAESVELTGDVVLTVSYVDENGDALADEKEISLSESIDFSSEAREIEGYTFKEASIDGTVIKVITAKKDADDHKYYEAELASGDTVEIKENKTVILTYAAEEEEIIADAKSVKITARYVDTDGEEIRDASELSITKELEFGDDYEEIIDGYFYNGVFFEEKEISGITPVVEEKSVKENDNKDDEELVEEPSEVTVTGYDITTKDGEVISVTEDTEIEFKYLKACEETEFTYSDQKIKVKIVTTRGGVFPEGIELKVNEVTSDTENYNYDAYMEALNENADSIANDAGQTAATQYTENNTLLYDIAFIYEGKEIQPKEGSVVVTMEFMEQQLTSDLSAQSESDVAVVHLPIKEEVKETAEIATTEEATDITSGDINVETLTEATAEVGGTEKVEFTSESFSVFAVVAYQDHEPGTDTFETVLGDAVNFGIVSESITVSESETNFATKELIASGQSGNDMTNPVEQTFIVVDTQVNDPEAKFTIKGQKAYFMVPYDTDAKDKIKHQDGYENIIFDTSYSRKNLEKIIDDMLKYTRAASADLKTRTDNASIETDKNDNARYMVDLTKNGYDPNGTYYVTLSDDYLKTFAEDQKLYIYKTSGQTIVFNVPQGGDIWLGKFMVSTDGGQLVGSDTLAGTKLDKVARTIIWNFENADNVYTGGGLAGVFIAGNESATWHNTNTSAGWIAFPNVEITAEFHNTYDEIKQISGAVQLEAYKNIDGEPAKVSGFKFKLAVLQLNANTGWRDLEIISNDENSPRNIIFDSVTFGGDPDYSGDGLYQYVDPDTMQTAQDGTRYAEFVFSIDEVYGTTDTEGNVYTEDDTDYFAYVTVSLQELNEHTKTQYYKVSQPLYYTDFYSPQFLTDSDRPVFNNTTQKGRVGLKLYKYLNGADPGDYKFTFTVRKLVKTGETGTDNHGRTYEKCKLEEDTSSLTNDGKNIIHELNYTSNNIITDENGAKHVYVVITENSGSVNGGDTEISADTDYILARIDDPDTDSPKVYYYKAQNTDTYCSRIDDDNYPEKYKLVSAICKGNYGCLINPENYAKDLAFYNTGTSMLRIHKMVVNDFGSQVVRDDMKSILNSVKFRITNNTTGNYVILKGFAAAEGTLSSNHLGEKAKEYDAITHVATGREFEVVCNGNAQWTILGLDIGTYTVEEVADGFTFEYNESTNESTVLMASPYSRVTMYAVTTDDEENTAEAIRKYGVGGENYRKVFSADVTEVATLSEKGPTNVKVGDMSVDNGTHTQTVQVANYYSTPIGPIQVTKNLIGGTVDKPTEFKFTLNPIGFTIKDSAGHNVVLPSGDDVLSQPMPVRVETVTEDGVTKQVVTTDNTATVTLDKGTNTAIAVFNNIPFRFEGIYKYTITEDSSDPKTGIKYDTKTYYVEITVKKKYTQFIKGYSYVKGMTHPAKYTGDTTINNEDFYYLGADVRYATDDKFQNVVAECELYLGYNPKTGKPDVKEFQIAYKNGTGISDVSFNNEITGDLTIIKKWIDKDGNLSPENHTELTLNIQNRAVGSSDWNLYKEIKLSSGNLQSDKTWKYVESNLPLIDEDGNRLEYRVVEPDSYRTLYLITYNYNGTDYDAGNCDNNPNYALGQTDKSDGTKSFGEVTITNKTVTINALPSTGGIGTSQFVAIGVLLMSIAFAGTMLLKKRRVF